MRKWLPPLILTLLCLLWGSPVWATEFTAVSPSGHTLRYSVNDDGASVSVIRNGTYWDNQLLIGDLIIPSTVTYNSTVYNVVSIAEGAFAECQITSVTIPGGIREIGSGAFSYCAELISVVLSDSITELSLGSKPFYGCWGINPVYNNALFVHMTDIYGGEAYSIPEGITTICDEAFRFCEGVSSVTIPNTVTTIGQGAFAECYSLTSVSVPSSVTSIGSWAFSGIPNVQYTGTAIGAPWGAAYMNCYVEGKLVYQDSTRRNIVSCCRWCYGVTIPNTVTTISDNAFYMCRGWFSVDLPNSVTYIGDGAFAGSEAFSIVLSDSLVYIGDGAFSGCYLLESIEIPNSVLSIGDNAFDECGQLESVVIGDGVTSIGEHAFSGCRYLSKVVFGKSVSNIGTEPFVGGSYCDSLRTIQFKCAIPPSTSDFFAQVNTSRLTIMVPVNDLYEYKYAWEEEIYFCNVVGMLQDGEAYTYSRGSEDTRVDYTRNFGSTNWQALYVPFTASYQQWHEYGSVARLVEVRKNSSGEHELVWEYLQTNEDVLAGYPYIFRPNATGETEMTFTSATLYNCNTAQTATFTCDDTTFTLHGVYDTLIAGTNGSPAVWYALTGGKFVHAGNGAQLPPLRIYFTIQDALGNHTTAPKRLVNILDGNEVDIDFVTPDQPQPPADNNYYDILGRRIDNPQPGCVYIHHGKKIIFER
ncbi:MAG: leucine-rich repeat domain-containing protein [Bacteroidales bacterium]|nr:leucine-rich repeat domain-containing protein [Bacteroidales bacterium]